MKPNRSSPAPRGPQLDADVHDALRSLGWIVPRCERDVLAAEGRLADAPADLPPGLADPKAVLAGASSLAGGPGRTIPLATDPDIDATLARAAREDRRIPPEIEEAMRRDRQAAERQSDHGSETP